MSIDIALTLISRTILVMYSSNSSLFLRWLTVCEFFDLVLLDVLPSYQILIDSLRVCRMPPRRNRHNPIPDAHSEEVDNNHQHGSEEEDHQQGPIPEEPVLPSQCARELAAAMIETSRSFVACGAESGRTMDVLREFRRMNPPKFSGQGDPLAADHWLVEILHVFDTLGIVEDRQRITFASY